MSRETRPLGQEIQHWLDRREMKPAHLAAATGITPQNIGNWLKGRRPQTVAPVLAIDRALRARGAIVRAYRRPAPLGDLADRVAGLEERMTDMEVTRETALPMVQSNMDEIAKLWNEVRDLAADVQRLVDPTPPELSAPPSLAQ